SRYGHSLFRRASLKGSTGGQQGVNREGVNRGLATAFPRAQKKEHFQKEHFHRVKVETQLFIRFSAIFSSSTDHTSPRLVQKGHKGMGGWERFEAT
ncbi:MAG: hypothetical protein ACI9TH_004919, partial [Kiritimatiellia bacterium]